MSFVSFLLPIVSAQDVSHQSCYLRHVQFKQHLPSSTMKRPAPVQFLPAKPVLFWALTDIPSINAKQLPGNPSASQGWTISSRECGSPQPPKRPSKGLPNERTPSIGRPASAPQLRSKTPAQAQQPCTTRGRKLQARQSHGREASREASKESKEASAMTVPFILSYDPRQKAAEKPDKRNSQQVELCARVPSGRPPSKGAQIKKQRMAWQESASDKMAQQLGYQPGLPRKPGAQSLIPKQVSDLPNVLAHMGRLKAEQLELAQQGEGLEGVKIKTCKDVCVLEFPDNGARLLVNRWRPGYSERTERQQPNRAQSAPGRRTRSSPQLSPSVSTGFPRTPVKPVQSVQSAQTGSQGISVLHFELIGQAE